MRAVRIIGVEWDGDESDPLTLKVEMPRDSQCAANWPKVCVNCLSVEEIRVPLQGSGRFQLEGRRLRREMVARVPYCGLCSPRKKLRPATFFWNVLLISLVGYAVAGGMCFAAGTSVALMGSGIMLAIAATPFLAWSAFRLIRPIKKVGAFSMEVEDNSLRATFVFDNPGYGEMFLRLNRRADNLTLPHGLEGTPRPFTGFPVRRTGDSSVKSGIKALADSAVFTTPRKTAAASAGAGESSAPKPKEASAPGVDLPPPPDQVQARGGSGKPLKTTKELPTSAARALAPKTTKELPTAAARALAPKTTKELPTTAARALAKDSTGEPPPTREIKAVPDDDAAPPPPPPPPPPAAPQPPEIADIPPQPDKAVASPKPVEPHAPAPAAEPSTDTEEALSPFKDLLPPASRRSSTEPAGDSEGGTLPPDPAYDGETYPTLDDFGGETPVDFDYAPTRPDYRKLDESPPQAPGDEVPSTHVDIMRPSFEELYTESGLEHPPQKTSGSPKDEPPPPESPPPGNDARKKE